MEGGLFKKYEVRILKNKEDKETIIQYIEDKIGVRLEEKEIQLDGKKITIQTTSTKRTILNGRNVRDVVKEKGYILP